jgi:hypothetical protein
MIYQSESFNASSQKRRDAKSGRLGKALRKNAANFSYPPVSRSKTSLQNTKKPPIKIVGAAPTPVKATSTIVGAASTAVRAIPTPFEATLTPVNTIQTVVRTTVTAV